jgi:hypothetical protein
MEQKEFNNAVIKDACDDHSNMDPSTTTLAGVKLSDVDVEGVDTRKVNFVCPMQICTGQIYVQ